MNDFINFGIDLGTTNSCIARWDGSDVRVFQNNDQMSVTPSVVHLRKAGQIVVGKRACNAAFSDPQNVAAEFKRLMGQSSNRAFPASGKSLSPEELSAEVLKSLREDVLRQTGEQVEAAVVTVPAAFGTLQCEATARAASLAGFTQCPLLQEPIAAAVAYGIMPGARDQQWMVFDLGGGTLDIAIISTRDGRLAVREQHGNNFCGGKDFDRKIVDAFLFPVLREEAPDKVRDPAAFEKFYRRLVLKAEEAKIDLSRAQQVTVNFSDLTNAKGQPIDREVVITRSQLEAEITPMLEECIGLADDTLSRAKMRGNELDRILLVGGPTQMPLIRKILGERLGAKVDFSLDPMTVVARGAAMYATGVKRDTGTNEVPRPMPGRVPIRLDYEPVSIMPRPLVAGCVEMGGAINGKEIKIDAEGGFWTSGWTPLAPDGFFQLEVTPQETKRSTQFTIQVRDASGRVLPTEPPSFQILRGLTPGSPPLPHAIWVEIARPDGSSGLDPVFRRGDPLPAKATVKYRASAALRPNEPGQFLAVKLWEGEVADDPDANTWVGHVRLYSQHIRRPIPEGAEIELTVRLDASRKVTVEAFVPHLNQHFTEELWLPQAEQPVPDMKEVAPEIETNFERIDGLVSRLRELDDREAEAEVERIRLAVEELHAEAVVSNAPSADAAARLRDRSRRLRGELAKVERSLGSPPDERKTNQGDIFKVAEAAAAEWGSPAQKKEVALLQRDLSRANECKDERAQQRAIQSLESIRWAVLFQQDWFWKEIFDSIRAPDQRFRNHEEAKVWLEAGAAAYSADNGPEIRKAVQELWKLQEPAVVDAQKQSALKAGVKKY